jgi:pyocin large subunit-like protein
MPARRGAIIAAVAAHNRAHKPLPHSAVRLLEAMFASDDICQQSHEALEDVTGLSRKSVQTVLRALLAAGIIAKEGTGAGRHANRYRLLPTVGSGA